MGTRSHVPTPACWLRWDASGARRQTMQSPARPGGRITPEEASTMRSRLEQPSSMTVYIVDDDDAVRLAFSRLLRSAGMRPLTYGTAEEFLDVVENSQAACILLDITMPSMNGHQLQEELQRRGVRLPVITVSARDDEETLNLARGMGAGLFLRKPVDDQALLDAIAWVTSPRPKSG